MKRPLVAMPKKGLSTGCDHLCNIKYSGVEIGRTRKNRAGLPLLKKTCPLAPEAAEIRYRMAFAPLPLVPRIPFGPGINAARYARSW
ncbi:hypothetical protein [Nitrosovibrio sp. Nv6]|uniref:hypothetical protein n=1 Tax=Nitrosovibrio sp. Nv6 TaxID=1855340 RepID=UPI0008C18F98|nr:hypothetical protein [Nitrosovibrio sp. Nv6]SEP35877.1 hypothetical protein SAMN05216316_2583 [Nitrosovibrio sp. Nv6]